MKKTKMENFNVDLDPSSFDNETDGCSDNQAVKDESKKSDNDSDNESND